MKVKVIINEDAAIRNGRNIFGVQEVDGIHPADLSQEQREELVSCRNQDYPINQFEPRDHEKIIPCKYKFIEATPEAVIAYLDARISAKKKFIEKSQKIAKEKFDERKKNILSKGLEGNLEQQLERFYIEGKPVLYTKWGKVSWYSSLDDPYLREFIDNDAELVALREEVEEESRRRTEKSKKEAEAIFMEQEDFRLKQEARREKVMADFVHQYGDENQKERFAEGLLPKKEILAIIEEQAFLPLKDFDRYDKITLKDAEDFCSDPDYFFPEEVEFKTEPASELDYEEFSVMKAIREAIMKERADVEVEPVRHWAELRGEKIIEKLSIRVKLHYKEFYFERDYAV